MVTIREKFTKVKKLSAPLQEALIFLRKNDLLTGEALFNIGLIIYGSIAISFLNAKGMSDDVQIIITFPLLFFIPGYAITQLSFYENKNTLEIFAMSVAISLALIPLFNYISLSGITLIPNTKWNEELAIIALILLSIIFVYRHVGKVIVEILAKLRSKVSRSMIQ